MLRTACLLGVVGLCIAFVAGSFSPRQRFADPNPEEQPEATRNYACYHDRLYGLQPAADALVFGASKTFYALDERAAAQAYASVTGEPLDVFKFAVPQTNPELTYAFFRDYLQHNPAPRVALFSLTRPRPLAPQPPVEYVHPLFANLAPAYLYGDVLASWQGMRHRVFAASDFLRLLLQHLDLSLTRLLVTDQHFTVPPGDNCAAERAVQGGTPVAAGDFVTLLAQQAHSLWPADAPAESIGSPESLLAAYRDNRFIADTITRISGEARERIAQRHFWRLGAAPTARSEDYYRRIVELGKRHGVAVGFYFIPIIMSPEPKAAEVEALGESLGAPVFTMPREYTLVSYYHYRDPAHVTAAARPLFSTWFASLVAELERR